MPSPEEEVSHRFLNNRNIRLFIKRDDLIHPEVSGNKWRKLKWNIENVLETGRDTILTFGGAHSNHIAATAAAAALYQLKSIGIIRGEEADPENPTLSFAREKGMELHRVSRSEYRRKEDRDYIESLRHQFGSFYYIPEGGQNHYGVQGCTELMKELNQNYDRIFVSCGTATTISGMVIGNRKNAHIVGVSALKGGYFLRETIKSYVQKTFQDQDTEAEMMNKVDILTDYSFGGYAKINSELVDFMRNFTSETGVKLDPIYTAKTAFAMIDQAKSNPPESQKKWLLIHTGGMQGLRAMESKIGYPIYVNC